jgi:uncharacterized membrane protein
MVIHDSTLKLHSGKFSVHKENGRNVGFTERMVSVFLGGVLLTRGIKNPLKAKFWYGAYLTYRGFTGRCLIYDQLGIDAKKAHAVNIRGEFVIDKPAREVYNFWRNLNNIPASVNHLLDVEMVDENLSRWKSNAFGKSFPINWEAEIVKDEPGRLIGWRAVKGSMLPHVGRVDFEENPDGLSTKLNIILSYRPPVGGVGIGLSRLLNPMFEEILKNEIKTFKHKIESKAPAYQVKAVNLQ